MKRTQWMCRRAASCCAYLILIAAVFAEENPREIMSRSIEAVKIKGAESRATLTLMDAKGNSRIRTFECMTKTDEKASVKKLLMRFVDPADVKGTALLTFDYDDKEDAMWIYMPALRKTRRIVSSEKTKSFMGSEFSNADMTAPNLDDCTYRLAGSEWTDGMDCWMIELVPVDEARKKEIGFSRKVCLIGKSDFVSRKTYYYDFEDRLVKVLTVRRIQAVGAGKYQPVDMEMENMQNKRKSAITLENVISNPTLSDDFFTTYSLEKQ